MRTFLSFSQFDVAVSPLLVTNLRSTAAYFLLLIPESRHHPQCENPPADATDGFHVLWSICQTNSFPSNTLHRRQLGTPVLAAVPSLCQIRRGNLALSRFRLLSNECGEYPDRNHPLRMPHSHDASGHGGWWWVLSHRLETSMGYHPLPRT